MVLLIRRKHLLAAVCLVLLFSTSVSLLAQTFRGTVSGMVTDRTGAAIPGAMVTIINPLTDFSLTIPSGKSGEYLFPELPVGLYKVTAKAAGFDTSTVDAVNVAVSKVTDLPIRMTVGGENTVVTVEANGVQTDTTSSSLVSVIDQSTVQNIPMNGRDFTQMVKLSPSVNINKSVNGSRTNGINYQLDGADNNDPWSNAVASNQGGVAGIAGGLIPIEAIDQFAIQNNAEADMGRNGGANANMVLRSGTNNIHGDLFYFDRNEFFAALSPIQPAGSRKPEIRNHQFGFTLGGPIWKDHTFLFLAGESQLANANNSVSDTVVTDAWITAATNFLKIYGRTPNPVALALYSGSGSNAGLFPAVSRSGPATTGNYLSNGKNSYNSFNGIIKLDHHFSDKETLSMHYLGTTGTQTADVGSHYADYFQTAPMHIHNISIVQNSVFTSHLINQVTFGGSYFLQTFNDANQNFNPAALGLNLGLTGVLAQGATQLNITGFDYTGATAPLGRTDVTGLVSDTLHWVIGRHSLKLGGEFRHSNVNVGYFTNGRGKFNFDGTRGPYGASSATTLAANCTTAGVTASNCSALENVADFLLGAPTNSAGAVILRNNPQRVYLVTSQDYFAQDDFQVSQKLTINFGVRYTYPGVVHDERQDLYNFDPSTRSFLPSPLYNKDLSDFAPRVGFSYSPRQDQRTVLRGSYGWFYDTPTVGQFVYNNINNGASPGIYGNPAGATPVYQVNAPASTTFSNGVAVFGSAAASSLGAFAINPNFKTAYLQNFNVNIEQQLSNSTLVTMSYVGSQGRRLGIVNDINQAVNGVRPYPTSATGTTLNGINQVNSHGSSNFNSLQVNVRQAPWHGLSNNLNYQWGRSMDFTSAVTTPENSYNLALDYGPSTFDVRNSMTDYVNYMVPQIAHFAPRLTKGWQLNTLATFAGGSPINILTGANTSGSGENKDRPNQIGMNPRVARTSIVSGSTIQYQYLAPQTAGTAVYVRQAAGTFGNTRRDSVYGPGLGSLDFSIFKLTPLTERINTELRAEVYNMLNQANFANPSGTITSGTFGRLTQTRNGSSAPGLGFGEPRNVQFALKLTF